MHHLAEPILRENTIPPEKPGNGSTPPSPEDPTSAPHRHSPFAADLRRREHATADMVRALDVKIDRLTQARADRIHALTKIRSAIARAIMAGPCAPAPHEKSD